MNRGPGGDTVLLEEVVDLAGEVDLHALAAAATGADVDAGVLTDEEVYWICGDADAQPNLHLDAPRLGALSAHDQDVALEAALWLLQARGDVVYDSASRSLEALGAHAVIGELRALPDAAVSVRVDVREEGTRQAALYRVRPDLFLGEEVSEVGLHHFVFRGLSRQAAWLAGFVDPARRARRGGQPRTASRPDDLDPHPDRLAATADTSALVYYGARGRPGRQPRRVFTAYGGRGGLHVVTGWQSPSGGAVTVQALAGDDLVAFCAAFLGHDADRAWQG